MKNSQYLKYKNYIGSVNIDTENILYYGKVEFISALITYEAQDAQGLVTAFHDSIDDYITFCDKQRIEPDQPFYTNLTSNW